MASDGTTQIFDFEEFLQSNDHFILIRKASKVGGTIGRVTGSISVIASTCIIIHILRSHHGLSTTYHRLVFGLSVADIIYSFFGYVVGFTMAPKEIDYIVPGAIGNQATCDAQGFLGTFGRCIAMAYNCSICFYFLAIVTYSKKDDFIRKKLEPWFHGISLIFPLVFASMILLINGYNSNGGICWFTSNSALPHCTKLESGQVRQEFTIPCGRGDGKYHPSLRHALQIVFYVYPLLVPAVIVVTMTFMYRTVHKTEAVMKRYGVGTLLLRNNDNGVQYHGDDRNVGENDSPPGSEEASGGNKRCMQWVEVNFLRKIPCIKTACCRNKEIPVRNVVKSRKRAVLSRAVGYVAAWFMAFIPSVFYVFLGQMGSPHTVILFVFILLPLQGLFNFMVYMYPKVRKAKNGPRRRRARLAVRNDDVKISWYRAFLKAYMSRGERKRSGTRNGYSRTVNSSVFRESRFRSTLKKLRISFFASKPTKTEVRVMTINQQQDKSQGYLSSKVREGRKIVLFGDAVESNGKDSCPASSPENRNSLVRFPLDLVREHDDIDMIEDGDESDSSDEMRDGFGNLEDYSEEIACSLR